MAVDIGGTFTDIVLETTNQRYSCKVLTSVNQPELGVMQGIKQLLKESGVDAKDIQSFIHGTTLATNALIERKGAKTAFVTTQGFRDVLGMGFEKRFDAYDINIEIPIELVERPLRFTVPERISATGRVLLALNEDAVRQVAQQIKQAQVNAVAIGFIHAWSHATHELRAEQIFKEILGDQVTICLSSQVCPEMREYERFSTTVANSYVRPLMSRYLQRLSEQVKQVGMRCQMLMMMSGGGLTTLQQAMRFPIRLVESGPAGGAILASFIAKESSFDRVMAFDMGGTTAKICLINDGEPERSRRFEVGRAWKNLKGSGLPLRIPVIELVEIGAGGGSIGRVDAMNRITVGPDSCGSTPGPACYGLSGIEPAVTDADLVLGRLNSEKFAAGRIHLQTSLSEKALMKKIGDPLQMDSYWSAVGMSEIVEENMANAARVHAIERGQSIPDFTMIAFGGAAPLHAVRLAQKLGIRRVVIPAGAGVGSAIGFLRAPVSFEVVRSHLCLLNQIDRVETQKLLNDMKIQAIEVVQPVDPSQALQVLRFAEFRYEGQGHELRIPVHDNEVNPLNDQTIIALTERFQKAYEKIYGLRIVGSLVEVVAWSVTVFTPGDKEHLTHQPDSFKNLASQQSRKVWDPGSNKIENFSVYWRFDLTFNDRISGPALIEENETTIVLLTGWHAWLDSKGHLVMENTK